MSRRGFDNNGNQSYFRGSSRNRRNNGRTDVNVESDIDFRNDIDNRADADAEADVRNVDRNTNISRSIVSNSGNSCVDIRLNSRSNARVRADQDQENDQDQNTDVDVDF